MSRVTVAAISLLLLGATFAQAGVFVVTGIGITTSQVNTYHYMEADSTTAYYYDVEVDAFMHRNSGPGTSYSVIKSGSAVGGAAAEKLLSNSKTNNRGYNAQTNAWMIVYFWYTSGPTVIYQDHLGYELLSPGSYGANGSVNPPGTYNEVYSAPVYIASGYLYDDTYLPAISGINVTGSPTPGGTGYVEIYGSNLAKWAGSSTASISGSGVTTAVTYQSYLNPGQINISYSISAGATPGNRNLTVATPFGTSNSKTFTIQP